jgi:protoporphyrinogen/coproporphyrinogen III oxidase
VSIIIIGGGIAGLAAGYELALRGVPFVLLEASDRAGGLVHTEKVAGFTIDAGADSMLIQKPAAVRLCEELGLGPRLIASNPPRTSFIYADDRLHPLPSPSVLGIPATPEAVASYDLLSEAARAELLRRGSDPRSSDSRSWPRGTETTPGGTVTDESVGDFFRRQFGPETVSLIAEPLLGGIHAGDVEQLSIASVAPRLVQAESESGSVLRGFRNAPPTAEADGLFRSLRGGMGELVTAIVDRFPPRALRLHSEALTIVRRETEWEVATSNNALTARAVIVAAPAHAAARLLFDVDPVAASLCAQVPYVSTVSVALSWPRERVSHPLAGSGFVVARQHSALRITACTWVSSKWENRAPEGAILLRAFLGGAADPDVAALPDASVVAIAVRDVVHVLGITGEPTLARVHRWTKAGAQHIVGHRARLERIEQRLARLPGVFVAGSGFRAIGIPDCVADGRAAGATAADYAKMHQ